MNIDLDYISLGKRIRKYRLQNHMTQEQLAEIIDAATSNISHIERATTKVSLPSLIRIANALHVSLDQLLYDSLHTVKSLYLNNDMAMLLSDCTVEEKKIICDIIEATKRTLRENR